MAHASITITLFMIIPVYVYQDSEVVNAKLILDLADQILAGTMVESTARVEMITINWFVGTCHQTSNTTFLCDCAPGWLDDQCQTMNDYCKNVTCLNNGICRQSLLNYTCECLTGSFSGRHCEITTNTLVLYQTLAKSFAYVVIIAIASVAAFVVGLDILKIFFGIDPAGSKSKQRQSMKRKAGKKRKKPVLIIRYVYIPGPSQKPIEKTVSSVWDRIFLLL